MRNLKKLFAVVIAVAMMLTAMAPAFAADTTAAKADTAASVAEKIGMLKGDGAPVDAKYLSTVPTRLQALIMFLRLKGLESEALKFDGKDNFADASDVEWDGGKAILAYAKANGEKLGIKGIGDNKYDPNAKMTADAYYKVMLESLGYVQDKDFKWEEVIKFAEGKGLKLVAASKNFTIADLATATLEALKATVKGDDKTTFADKLVKDKVLSADNAKAIADFVFPSGEVGPAAVKEVVVKSANSIAVRFVNPLANTKNITATVKNSNIEVALTAAWDKDNKEMTLSKDTRLISGDYTVEVKDGSKDLGTKTVTVEQEKLAKIDITSDSLIRYIDRGSDLKSTEDDSYRGEFNYKAYNQYGDDITDSALAANMQWFFNVTANTGTTPEYKKGKVTIISDSFAPDKYYYLKELTATVNVNDNNNFVTASKTLKISENFGGIASIDLKSIANPDNAQLRAAAPETFYIDYDIKDADGNAITSLDILKNSVDLQVSNRNAFRNPTTETQDAVVWEEDPLNSNNARIAVYFNNADTTTYDQVISITAISMQSGKSDVLQFDLKKPQMLTKFQLMPFPQEIAAGETAELSFVAYDQDNAVMTDKLQDNVKINISGGSYEDNDGKFKSENGVDKYYIKFNDAKSYTITANVSNNGSFSQISVNVRSTAVPTYLNSVKTDIILPAIVANGTMEADFDDDLAFKVLDQYDREFDLYRNYKAAGNEYYIKAESKGTEYVEVNSANSEAYGNNKIILQGTNDDKIGSASVVFSLMRRGSDRPIDTKTVSIMKVKKDDVTKYEFSNAAELTNMWTGNRNVKTTTFDEKYMEYFPYVKIFGKLSNGLSVAIDKTDILNLAVSNPTNFAVKEDSVGKFVYSGNVDEDAEVNGTLTATIRQGTTNRVVTTALKGLYATPAAKSIEVSFAPDTVKQKSGDTYWVYASKFTTGMKLYKYEGTKVDDADKNPTNFYFSVVDQYGAKAIAPDMILNGSDSLADKVVPSIKIADDKVRPVQAGDSFVFTVITDNGLMKTVTVNVVAD